MPSPARSLIDVPPDANRRSTTGWCATIITRTDPQSPIMADDATDPFAHLEWEESD